MRGEAGNWASGIGQAPLDLGQMTSVNVVRGRSSRGDTAFTTSTNSL
jgi:hypothetical protein